MSDSLPFEGVKVADFSWVGVGPITAKYLASLHARRGFIDGSQFLGVVQPSS